jgi:Flp pilus assembly protein TadD
MEADTELTEQDVLTVVPSLQAAHRADLMDALLPAVSLHRPLSTAGLRYLGAAQEAEGKSAEAGVTFQRMFAMDSTSAAPLVELARIAIASKDYKEALGYLAHARALQPTDASLPYEYGIVCLKMDLIGAARRAFADAVKLEPDNPQYNLVLGTLLSSAEGLPYLNKYQELRPGNSVGALALGVAYFQANDFNNSTTWLARAVGGPSTAAAAHYYLGKILLQEGHSDLAVAELSKSARLRADQPDVLAELGGIYADGELCAGTK